MKKALWSLTVAAVAFGFTGCGEKPKDPIKDAGNAARDVIKQGKETAKEVKSEVDKAAKEVKK